jgi:hypothetical protein
MECRIPGLVALIGLLTIGCGDESPLPELRYEGEHVLVGTDFDTPICGGTLSDFDREIERIESRLELDAEGKTALWILGDVSLYESYCPDNTRGCEAWGTTGGVLTRQSSPDVTDPHLHIKEHVLAHDRVSRAARPRLATSNGFFVEGMSEALARAYCEPAIEWTPDPAFTDAMLAAGKEHADFNFLEGSLAGHLMRWLLDTHGPDLVQDFMVAVQYDDPPDVVREVYTAYFGSSLDEDLYAHIDWSVDDRHPFELGCRGEPPPVEEPGESWLIQANLDCDSPLVHSNYYEFRPGRTGIGWTEWLVEVETGGYYEIVGEVPEGTELSIALCHCEDLDNTYWSGGDPTDAHPFTGEYLEPGRWRIVWKGPLNGSELLDVRLVRE